MFLSTIELGPDAEHEPAFWREVAAPGGAHRALWRLFSRGPEQRRDFLFRHETAMGGRPRFYALSAQPPLEEVGNGLWSIKARPFAPKLVEGDRLHFSLRASPTVAKKTKETEKGRKSRRHDLVMDAKRRAKDRKNFDLVTAVREAGERWLGGQALRSGFELARGPAEVVGDDGLFEEQEVVLLKVDGYRQHRLLRRGKSPIQFSTVDYEGVLVVRDPAVFVKQVGLGFGPQRAFGCGLMLLRRA